MIPAALRVRAAPGERARAGPWSAPLPPVSGPLPAPGDLRPPQNARGGPPIPAPRQMGKTEAGRRVLLSVSRRHPRRVHKLARSALGPDSRQPAPQRQLTAFPGPPARGIQARAGLCNVCVPPAPEADTARNRLCINTAGSTREVLTAQEQNFTTEARSVSSELRRQPRGSERRGDAVCLYSQRCLLQSTWFWEEASWQEERPLPHGRPSGRPAGPWHSQCAPEPSGGGPCAERRLPGGCAPRASAGRYTASLAQARDK